MSSTKPKKVLDVVHLGLLLKTLLNSSRLLKSGFSEYRSEEICLQINSKIQSVQQKMRHWNWSQYHWEILKTLALIYNSFNIEEAIFVFYST